MEINTALEIWITHITKIIQGKSNNAYDQRSINGFKNGTKTSASYSLLVSQLNDNKPMDIKNVDSIILKAYYTIPFNCLDQISYIFLQHSTNKKFFLYDEFDTPTLNRLKTILQDAKDQFRNLEEEDEEIQNQERNTTASALNQDTTATLTQTSTQHTDLSSINSATVAKTQSEEIQLFQKNMIDSITSALNRNLEDRLSNVQSEIMKLKSKFSNPSCNHSILEGNLTDIKKEIMSNMSKISKLKQHNNNFKLHKRNNTHPSQLSFRNFPEPLFKHDKSFVTKFEDLLKGFQSDISSLITDHIESKLKNLESDLQNNKSILNQHTRDDSTTNHIMDELYMEVERSHKKDADRSFQKALRRVSIVEHCNSNLTPNNFKRKQASNSPEEASTSDYYTFNSSDSRLKQSTPASSLPYHNGYHNNRRHFSHNNNNQSHRNSNYHRAEQTQQQHQSFSNQVRK